MVSDGECVTQTTDKLWKGLKEFITPKRGSKKWAAKKYGLDMKNYTSDSSDSDESQESVLEEKNSCGDDIFVNDGNECCSDRAKEMGKENDGTEEKEEQDKSEDVEEKWNGVEEQQEVVDQKRQDYEQGQNDTEKLGKEKLLVAKLSCDERKIGKELLEEFTSNNTRAKKFRKMKKKINRQQNRKTMRQNCFFKFRRLLKFTSC